jgi:hypothetical protein
MSRAGAKPRNKESDGEITVEKNQGKSWTPEELQAVRTLYIQRVPVAEIARQMGRSYMAIVSRLQRLGLMDRESLLRAA